MAFNAASCRHFLHTSGAALPLPLLESPARAVDVPQTHVELWADFDPRKDQLESEVLKEWEQDGGLPDCALSGRQGGQPTRCLHDHPARTFLRRGDRRHDAAGSGAVNADVRLPGIPSEREIRVQSSEQHTAREVDEIAAFGFEVGSHRVSTWRQIGFHVLPLASRSRYLASGCRPPCVTYSSRVSMPSWLASHLSKRSAAAFASDWCAR